MLLSIFFYFHSLCDNYSRMRSDICVTSWWATKRNIFSSSYQQSIKSFSTMFVHFFGWTRATRWNHIYIVQLTWITTRVREKCCTLMWLVSKSKEFFLNLFSFLLILSFSPLNILIKLKIMQIVELPSVKFLHVAPNIWTSIRKCNHQIQLIWLIRHSVDVIVVQICHDDAYHYIEL